MRKLATLLILILAIGCRKDTFDEATPARGIPEKSQEVYDVIQNYEGSNAEELKDLTVKDLQYVMEHPVHQQKSLADSLVVDDYTCYARRSHETQYVEFYCPTVDVFLDLVSNYGELSPNCWNLQPGNGVTTMEILAGLTGFGVECPTQPEPFEDYEIETNFGS